MVLFKHLYSTLNSRGPTEAILVRLAKKQILRSDKEAERLDDKKEARADGGRRCDDISPI